MTTQTQHTQLPLDLGEPRSFGALTLVPLFPLKPRELQYIGLDEAIARGLSVTEVDGAAPSTRCSSRTRSASSSSSGAATRGRGVAYVLQMCYMAPHERVGVRALRQNLSVYLRRVEQGEVFEVTDRGRAVARLAPAATGSTWLDQMIADGAIRPATRRLADLAAPATLREASPLTISEALEEQRAEST